jgi:hypothetical protein
MESGIGFIFFSKIQLYSNRSGFGHPGLKYPCQVRGQHVVLEGYEPGTAWCIERGLVTPFEGSAPLSLDGMLFQMDAVRAAAGGPIPYFYKGGIHKYYTDMFDTATNIAIETKAAYIVRISGPEEVRRHQ